MDVTLAELTNNSSKRVRARLSRHCTVTLTSGKKIKFDKLLRLYSYEGEMTKQDEQELWEAVKLLKI